MDLQSYIQLKKQYAQMHTPQQESVSEEVEAVGEEILGEEDLQENPNTWNNPLGQISRTATKMFGNAQQIKGVRQNEKDIADRENQVFKDGGGNARQRELEKKGYLSGQARRAVMNQGDRNRAQARRAQASSSSSSSSRSSNSGARDPESGLPMDGGSRSSSSSSRSSNSGARDPESGLPMNKGGSSSNSGTSQSAQSSSRRSSSSGSSGSSQRASSSSSQRSSGSSSSQPVAKATSAAPKGDTMAGKSKSERMSAWAKANPELAKAQKARQATRGTTASSNPMMKGLGRSTTSAPKASTASGSTAPKASPSAGARAALSAAGAKFNPNAPKIKLTNSVDMSEFDVILEHLVEQGFPVEEALKLMVNMPEEKRAQILEAGMHREADTGKVVDKAEPGKTYYPNMPKKKSSVALRKEKEAAAKKTQKEEVEAVEEGMHREADTGKVVDKAEVGKTYYPNMPKKKSSVALRKEKEAAEKKTRKEDTSSLLDAYRSMYVKEEESDARKDRQLERGGVGARADYSKPPTNPEKKRERKAGPSAMDVVKAELKKKYGDKAIIDTKKKKD